MLQIGLGIGLIVLLYMIFFVVPAAQGLGDYVRIAFFHIPLAWVSVIAFLLSAFWAARYLKARRFYYDYLSAGAAKLGLVFCLLATISGAVFAKLTWGAYWNWDPRQTTIFILLLLYGAYMSLRASIADERQRAATASVYSLLAAATVPFLVFVIPRFFFSLHPEPVINSTGSLAMDVSMLWTLAVALIWHTALFFYLLLRRKVGNGDA